jgi:hypothetical protein
MSSSTWFEKKLIQLSGRLKNLQTKISRVSVFELEREANTWDAELHLLYDYAIQHEIHLMQYYQQLSDIEALLCNVKEQIAIRAQVERRKKSSGWRRILGVVVRAINFVTTLLRLRPAASRLGPGTRPPSLPPG